MSDARERLLQKVQAVRQETDTVLPAPVPVLPEADLAGRFARELAKLDGELIRADSFETAAQELIRLTAPQDRKWFIAQRDLPQALAAHLPVTLAERQELAECQASVLEANFAIADTATVGLTLDARQPRACHLLPEICIVMVPAARLMPTLATALLALSGQQLPTGYVFVTGPSRTADIEKTVVIPAHGPKRLIVVLLS